MNSVSTHMEQNDIVLGTSTDLARLLQDLYVVVLVCKGRPLDFSATSFSWGRVDDFNNLAHFIVRLIKRARGQPASEHAKTVRYVCKSQIVFSPTSCKSLRVPVKKPLN